MKKADDLPHGYYATVIGRHLGASALDRIHFTAREVWNTVTGDSGTEGDKVVIQSRDT